MEKISNKNIYSTTNADLAAFLYLNGIKLYRLTTEEINNKKQVVIQFIDEKNNILDLELIYQKSNEKKHHEFYRWFLTKIHQELRSN